MQLCLVCCVLYRPHLSMGQRYADARNETEGGEGGGGGEEMFVISRNSLVTPVEMVGADKITEKTR